MQRLLKASDRANLPFKFVMINGSVPSAWALSGGKLTINRGLLTELKSEAEPAAVLAHEIAHAATGHGVRAVEQGTLLSAGATIIRVLAANGSQSEIIEFATQDGAALLSFRSSREQELVADEYGIDYMVRAGYEPLAAVELQEILARLSGGKAPGLPAGMFASRQARRRRADALRPAAQSGQRCSDRSGQVVRATPGGVIDKHRASSDATRSRLADIRREWSCQPALMHNINAYQGHHQPHPS